MYAIGEIVLVVIGDFEALEINKIYILDWFCRKGIGQKSRTKADGNGLRYGLALVIGKQHQGASVLQKEQL